MPSSDENDPSQPPRNTSANALSRPDAAASKPGVAHDTLPPVTRYTIHRTTSPTRQVISIRMPNTVFGSVQIAPRMLSSTPPNDQCPFGSVPPTGSWPQNANRFRQRG